MSRKLAFVVGGALVLIVAIWMVTDGSNDKTTKSSAASPVTGFGATVADWDAHHEADSRFVPGSAYDPDPSLARGGDQRYNARYYAVGHDGGRIFNYEMRFPPGTDIQQAKRSVLASEFPSDAKIAWFKRLDTCAQMLVRSRKVARALGGTRIAALVEFSSGEAGDSYDPSDVWDAILIALPEPVNLGC